MSASHLLNKKSRGKGCVGVGGEKRKDAAERKVWGWGCKCDPMVYSTVLPQTGLHQIFFFLFFFFKGGGDDAIMAASSAKSLQGLIQIN